MMNSNKTFRLVLGAVFCALVFTFTWIAIPVAIGNINLGDCMIILCAYILGGSTSIFASALGASICDLASGYAIYASGTFIIKALMVMVMLIARKRFLKSDKYISLIISGVFAEIIMVVGYFLYEAFILGYGLGAIMNAPFSLIQGVINIIVAVILFAMLKKAGIVKK